MNNTLDIGVIIEEETKKRLAAMESGDYVFPEKAGKRDAIAIVAGVAACGVLILCCMLGVIV